jgi:hypothetical protein
MWLSFNVQQDFSFIPAQQDVCGTQKNDIPPAFTCTYEDDGSLYDGRPEASDPEAGTGNEIVGGTRLSTLRLLLDLSYLLGKNISIGARGGYVLKTNPNRSLAKIHLEGRVAYWFGGDPFAKQSLRLYVAAMGGLAEVDDKFSVQVNETDPGLPANPTLIVYRRGAKTFAGAAAGVMIPTSASMGILLEVKGQWFFPNPAFTLSPSVGYAIGF